VRGTGFDPNNFAILLSLWSCGAPGGGNDFDPSNYRWGGNAGIDGLDTWETAAGQVLITDTSSVNGVTYAQDAVTQNGVLTINLNGPVMSKLKGNGDYVYNFATDPGIGTNPVTLVDGDVVLVEVADAANVVNRVAAAVRTLRRAKVSDAEIASAAYSDGIHDFPQIKWSRYSENYNTGEDETAEFIASDNSPFTVGINANHEDYDDPVNETGYLTERFKFKGGNTQTNYGYAWSNPSKHFIRMDETDSDNSGSHAGLDYTAHVEDATSFLPTVIAATIPADLGQDALDTLGWFYVDQVGPVVDLDAVYPMMRRDNDEYSNQRLAGEDEGVSYTSDPYQVITLDVTDVSCYTYADSFAAGLDINQLELNIKVTDCDGNYHPAYGPEGLTITTLTNPALVAANAAPSNTPCFYVNDPTTINTAPYAGGDPQTPDVIYGIWFEQGGAANADLAGIGTGTRIVFDPRLGPKDVNQVLKLGLDEPLYRFRNGDKVCVTVKAKDASTGDCANQTGNNLLNLSYAADGTTAIANLFSYKFIVDLQEPTIVARPGTITCNHPAYVDFSINDVCDSCELSGINDECQKHVSGIDSLFFEVKHFDYSEATGVLATIPTIARFAVGSHAGIATSPDVIFGANTVAYGLASALNGAAGTAYPNTEPAMHNRYDNVAGPMDVNLDWMVGEITFSCGTFTDGDSVFIQAWGRDDIDVPWYPIAGAAYAAGSSDAARFPDAFDRDNQYYQIWHTNQGYATTDYNFRRYHEHANADYDSTLVPDTTVYTKGFFYTRNVNQLWWKGFDWSVAKDSVTNSRPTEVPGTPSFAFGNIHWLWQCPWAYDYLSRLAGLPNADSLIINTGKDSTGNNNAWDDDYLNDDTQVENGFADNDTIRADEDGIILWDNDLAVAGESINDPYDYDWTDLDSIPVANHIHHNWAKPATWSQRFNQSFRPTTITDRDDFEGCQDVEAWTWPAAYPAKSYTPQPADDVSDGAAPSIDLQDINCHRTGLVDNISATFTSCYNLVYCDDSRNRDTTVGFAMECYDKSGNIKWIWPFPKNSTSYYNNGAAAANWENQWGVDKKAVDSMYSLSAADTLQLPIRYQWWDCNCPNCNGVTWTATSTAGGCVGYLYTLNVDLDYVSTWMRTGTYNGKQVSISRYTGTNKWTPDANVYEDGDSVVCYVVTAAREGDHWLTDDHLVRVAWYYLIDKQKPAVTFKDFEIYVPDQASIAYANLQAKGDFDMDLEARYNDVVRMIVHNAKDLNNTGHATRAVGLAAQIAGATTGITSIRSLTATNVLSVSPAGTTPTYTNAGTNPWTAGAYTSDPKLDDALCEIFSGPDTTYYHALQIRDDRTNVREYVATFSFSVQDRLCNDSVVTRTIVVDNIRPGLMWKYCADSLNKFFDRTNKYANGDSLFLGYWLNGEAGTIYSQDVDNFIDTLGVGIYQDNENQTTHYSQLPDGSVIELQGHLQGQDRTDEIRLCRGQLYILVNFNDLMYTGNQDNSSDNFNETRTVKVKTEKGSEKRVAAVPLEDVNRVIDKLQYINEDPLLVVNAGKKTIKIANNTKDKMAVIKGIKNSKKSKVQAKGEFSDGWIDENSWLGQVYIDTTGVWDGKGKLMVTGFYDRAGNKMEADTSCFRVTFSTKNGGITITNPVDNDEMGGPVVNTVVSGDSLKATVTNLASVDSIIWFYQISKAAVDDTIHHDSVQLTLGAYTMKDSMTRTAGYRPNANPDPVNNTVAVNGRPFLSNRGAAKETTVVHVDSGNVAGTSRIEPFTTGRKQVTYWACVASSNTCRGRVYDKVDNVEVDYEPPYFNNCGTMGARTVASNYEDIQLILDIWDDQSYYGEATTAARAEIDSVQLKVWDCTLFDTPATGIWNDIPDSVVNPVAPFDPDTVTIDGDKLAVITGGNKFDSLHIMVIAFDNRGNVDTCTVIIPQIVDLPTVLARGNDIEQAIRSSNLKDVNATSTTAYPRSPWPTDYTMQTAKTYSVDGKQFNVSSLQITTFTHYNAADKNADVNDPFGRDFTTSVREYPGDHVYIVSYDVDNYLDDDTLYYVVEGADNANKIYNSSTKLFGNGENVEQKLKAETITINGTKFYYAEWVIEDENEGEDGVVRITTGVKAGSAWPPSKNIDYTWVLLDTEDPIYSVNYTDNSNVALPSVIVAKTVKNTETIGDNQTVDKDLALAGTSVQITNAKMINAFITMDQTVSEYNSAAGKAVGLPGTARLWAHVNVDFEAPTAINKRASDESFYIDIDSTVDQVFKSYNNWIPADTLTTYMFSTTIKNGTQGTNDGFAWVKVEERDAAGNYVRDWSTDKCTGMVVYIDTKAPSAPITSKLGAIPAAKAVAAGFGSDRFSAAAQNGSYKVFGYAGAALDDSWSNADLTLNEASAPTVKVYSNDAKTTLLNSGKAKLDGSFSITVTTLPTDSTFYVSLTDIAGNESSVTAVKLATPVTVLVPLNPGWNLISVNVIGDDLTKVLKDDNASSVYPVFDYFYTIKRDGTPAGFKKADIEAFYGKDATITIGENQLAYWIKVKNSCTLKVTGIPVDTRKTIALTPNQWNYVAYLPNTQAKISAAIEASSLEDISRIASDVNIANITAGVPDEDFTMYPFQGYIMMADSSADTVTLQYKNGTSTGLAKAVPSPRKSDVTVTRFFQQYVGTATFYGKPAIEGDKVEVFDNNGVKCGDGVFGKDSKYSVMVYGDDPLSDNDEGAVAGQDLNIKINGHEAVFDYSPLFAGDYSRSALNLIVKKAIPKTFSLGQNVPNPFNPSTVIDFTVPSTSQINLSIYNVLGQKVVTLVNEVKEAGTYKIKWNGNDEKGASVASGVYFYKMDAGNFTKVREMNLIK